MPRLLPAEFTDARLVSMYETVNAYDPAAQPGFYLRLAAELGARSIVDLGCGTGLISRELARQGHTVIAAGHVAQFFLTDESWHAALSALHRALRPDGWLAFESRDPAAREWERWTSAHRRSVKDPVVGRIVTWTEVHRIEPGLVTYTNHYLLVDGDQELVSQGALRFRTAEELGQSLVDAGFKAQRIYGDWDRRPAGPSTRELIFVATRVG